VAEVAIAYNNMKTRKRDRIKDDTYVTFTKSPEVVKTKANRKVKIQAAKTMANIASQEAVKLRDKGDVLGAQRLLKSNAMILNEQSRELKAPELRMEGEEFQKDADDIAKDKEWNKKRKKLRKKQHKAATQSSY
jgi:hypothetical protein